MKTDDVQKKTTTVNAIDYIKNSTIFTNPRYKWIIPLTTKVLEDDLCDADIDELVDSFLPKKKSKTEKTQPTQPEPRLKSDDEGDDVDIKKINSIDKISNIGLLDVKDPIVLKDGLNVFYGKNGAGKSSIYLGLCKVLGKSKSICSNIATKSDKSCCEITIEGDDDNDYTLKWNTEDENEESKVMIFDGLISNHIVEYAQENQFKMAHLKMEYFSFLHDLYQKIGSKLNQELNIINTKYETIEQVLAEKTPSVFKEEFDWDEKKIKELDFTKKDEGSLVELNRQIKILEKNDPGAVVRNIGNALEATEDILSVFSKLNGKEVENGGIEYGWELLYDKDYFEGINGQIDKYNKVKKAFEKSGKNKISSFISPEWIDKDTWEKFISSSMDFLNSLDEDEAKKYTEEKCAYCQQPLQTKEAKILVRAYQELHDEHKEKLNEEAKELEEVSEVMGKCIEAIDGISAKNKKIEQELDSIGEKSQITFDFKNVKAVFQKYKTAITKAEKVKIEGVYIKVVEDFWNVYEPLFGKFKAKINKLNKDITDKDGKIKKLEAKVESLEEKKSLYESKNNILKYLKLYDFKEILSGKIFDITPLRQVTSSLKTSFANEATLKEFKKYLKTEYDFFNFLLPEKWNIAPATRSDVNKRVYSIGDKRLAEIFSEGERKLHALSDFFAQCELNKYKGVYVFDDPVNSLDEDNIEVVAERIIKLAEGDNQVIVFTHNLYFLNSLIENGKLKINKLEKNKSQINILRDIDIDSDSELKEILKRIKYEMGILAKKDLERINKYEMGSVYCLISRYLEEYVMKIYFKNVISRYRPNIRMDSLDKLSNLETSKIKEILTIYKKTNRKCTRHSQPEGVKDPIYDELKGDVKTLFKNYKY